LSTAPDSTVTVATALAVASQSVILQRGICDKGIRMNRQETKTLLVTGGAKRIGKSIALAAAAAGFDVAVHYRSSKEEAELVAEDIRKIGRRAYSVGGDLNEPGEAEAVVSRTLDAAGRLDALVSSASIFNKSGLLDFSLFELECEVRVNAFAPLLLARAFRARCDKGVVIHLLDSRMTSYDKLHAAYHLSKRMLYDLTRLLAIELAPKFRVNGVAPGLILPPQGEPMSYLEEHKHENLLNRCGSTEEIARAVMFLVESEFITGQVIHVDGGRNLKGSVYG
jgi:NAD(P)-dependent dehydrogenase (short-subunit alcohol dehydrogenase family)